MDIILICVAGVLTAVALHPFCTYPLSLALLARVSPKPIKLGTSFVCEQPPHVALCVCAYNEASVIRAKAENMLAMRADLPGLELFIWVDGATDSTPEILAEYADRINIIVSPNRQGKTHGMNTLISRTTADYIVFSDANVVFSPKSIINLLQPFADASVGCVCGHLIYSTTDGCAAAGSLYWRLEEHTKELESRIGSVMGADGSIFAIRRTLHCPPPNDIIDDMYVSLSILCEGHRIVRAGNAIAYETTVSQPAEEFRRKIRISCQAFNVHRLLRPRLHHLSALQQYMYISHKLLRWFTGYTLAGALVCLTTGLIFAGAWSVIGVGVGMFICLVSACRLQPSGPVGCVTDIIFAFFATSFGVIQSLRGARFQTWNPPSSARIMTGQP